MSLAAGSRLGPYEILSALGAGGMGEVYRARDTKLNRDVALKVLPDSFATDPDRLARFQREAQVLASLNHPNIAHIHGLEDSGGVRALVMELVEGEDLAQRLTRGAIPIDEALPIAKQIAEALEAAHEQGIIHRDLKPANIKLRPDGTVKVLDFGLAKALEVVASRSDVSQSPTITTPAMTRMGVVLGTAAYMSPEQARGKAVDRRADLWAFGCVLFEMLTGRAPFQGETVTDVLAAVVKEEPPWLALPDVPRTVRTLLGRCLAKDPRSRLQAVGDARLEIDDILQGRSTEGVHDSSPSRKRTVLPWVAAAVFLTVIGTAAVAFWPKPVDAPGYRTTILPPPGVTIRDAAGNVPGRRLSLSPDGRQLAFTGTTPDGRTRLWVLSLDGASPRMLEGTDGATFPFWSPDSRSLAFFTEGQRGNAILKKVALFGGSPTTLCELSGPNGSGGTWNRDDVILYGSISHGPIRRVATSGGGCSDVTKLNADNRETSHIYPFFLPDGHHFLYLATAQVNAGPSAGGIFVGSIDSSEQRLLVHDGVSAKYANGHVLFMRGRVLLAQAFDAKRLTLSGEAVPLASDLQLGGQVGFSVGGMSVSETGALVYLAGSTAASGLRWLDRVGKGLGPLGEAADYSEIGLAPDGMHASVSIVDPTQYTRDVWIFDIARGLGVRFTDDPVADTSPIWSPDGKRVMFASARTGPTNLYEKVATGATPEIPWFADEINKSPLSWAMDGRVLYQTTGQDTGNDLWIVAAPSDNSSKPSPFRRTRFNETLGQFSPDGRWVAYVSDGSGRQEIYIARSDGTGGPSLVAPGTEPRWRRDGREIYFWAENRLLAAPVKPGESTVDVGAITPLFEYLRRTSGDRFSYDVSADGQKFLINTFAEATTPVTLLLNWPTLLKK